jgi:hypothetical protein
MMLHHGVSNIRSSSDIDTTGVHAAHLPVSIIGSSATRLNRCETENELDQSRRWVIPYTVNKKSAAVSARGLIAELTCFRTKTTSSVVMVWLPS